MTHRDDSVRMTGAGSGGSAAAPGSVFPVPERPAGVPGDAEVGAPPGPDFLRRVRRTTLALGSLCLLALAVYGGWRPAAAAGSGLAVSLANLRLLEEIFRQLLTPGRQNRKALALAFALKLPLLVGGTALALGPLRLPPVWYAAGFSLVLAVCVLKVLGIMMVRANRRSRRVDRPQVASSGGPQRRSMRPGAFLVATALGPAAGLASVLLAAGPARAAGEGGGHGVPELPNLFGVLHELFRDARWAATLYAWQYTIISTLILVLLCVIAVRVYARRRLIPGPLQNVVEMIVEGFSNFILGILGPRGKEFVPFLGTLFLYIWLNNLAGLLPLAMSPTSKFTTTVSLAICVFAYVQYTGITKLGLKGYVHHMFGSPRDATGWALVPLMFPLHVIEELAKPLTLSLRLFGNVLGEDALLGVFAALGVLCLSFIKIPIGIPLHLPFIFLAVLLSTIQALVFTLLSTIYFLQMLPHDDHGHDDHAGAGAGEGHGP